MRAVFGQLMSECGKDATIVALHEDSDFPGTYIIEATVEGTPAMFTYTMGSGDFGEGDQAGAAIITECGIQ